MVNELTHSVDRLQATLSKMEITLGAIADAVVWIGEDCRVQWCNPAFERLVNQPHTTIIGSHLQKLLPLAQAGYPIPPESYPDRLLQKGEYELQQNEGTLVLEISGNSVTADSDTFTILVIRDVTQTKQAAAEQRQTERELLSVLRATLESTADGIFVVNWERDVCVFNQKFVRMWSIPEALLQPNRRDERIKFLADQAKDPEDIIAKVSELLSKRPQATLCEVVELKDGRIVECYSQPLWKGEQAMGRSWSFRDITEHKRIEAALQQQAAAIQASIDGIAILDSNQTYTYLNESHAKIFGYDNAEELVGKSWRVLYSEAERKRSEQEILPKLSLTGQWRGEVFGRRRDGSEFPQEVSLSATQDGGLICVVRDISDRKLAEEALQQSELKFRRLFENSQVGIFRTRIEDGLFVDANQRCLELLGYSTAEEVIGRKYATEFYVNLGDRERMLRELLARGKANNYELQVWRRDGTTFWALYSTQLNAEENCLDGVITDISDRKQAEDALKSLVATTASATGTEFFSATVRHLANLFGVRYAIIAEIVGGAKTARTLSFWGGSALVDSVEYCTTGTPCDVVLKQGMCYFPQGVQKLFPQNTVFAELSIESYQGVSLIDSAGQTIGLVAILDVKPLPREEPARSILQIFAARIATELERQHAEEALRQSEAQFRALFEATSTAAVIVDEQGFIDCNSAAEQLFGYSRQALLRIKPGDLSPPFQPNGQVSYSFADEQIAQALRQGNHRFEWVHRRADGTDFPAEVWLTAVEVSDRKFVQAVIRDLTERKQLEAALAERATLAAFRADIGSALAQSDNLQVILTQCAKTVVKRLNAAFACIWTLNAEKNVLELQASAGIYTHLNGDCSRIAVDSSLVGLIAQEQQPHLTNTLPDNPRIPGEEWVKREDLVSFTGYPLMLDQQLLGVIAMFARQPIPTSTFEALGFAASQIALGIRRKQVEAALSESEAKFRRMVENARDVVYTLKPDGTIVYVAPNVRNSLGYEPVELEGKSFLHFIHPDDLQSSVDTLNRLLATGEGQLERECRVRHKEGHWCWHTPTIAPYQDVNGQLMVVAIARDVSDRKQAEEALRLIVEGTAAKTGEEFFQSCVRYLVEVLRVRYALVTEVANEAKTRVRTLAFWAGENTSDFECDLDSEYDLEGTPCAMVYQDQTSYYPENLQALFPNDPHLVAFNAESYLGMLLTDSSGHTLGHLAVLDVKPMKSNPGRELIMKIFASRAGAELERKQTEEKFAKAFRSSPSPIAISNLSERRFIDVNNSFLKMCGYSLEEVIGHTAAELNLGVAEETYTQAIQQALETGSLHNQEFKFRTKSGEVKTVLLSIELIDLAGAQCVLNIINDITERKRLENELISLVSHELRTPMTSLLGALDLLGSGQLGTLTPQGQQVLNIATNNTERLTRLVNDILDLERMKSGKVVMQKVKCNVAELLTQASESMQAMAAKTQITLVTEPLTAELLADPDRILQTLTNLLSNAIKFSKPGGTVWLRVQLQPNTVEIQVEDQGRGIPEDKLQIIFDRFQQVDASDSRKKGGTGLGLAICRNIVEQHDGKIWVESVLGQGSIFHISLPLLH
jgi:PAS domain S-box-containing protein